MCSIARITGVSFNTVAKLVIDAGEVCTAVTAKMARIMHAIIKSGANSPLFEAAVSGERTPLRLSREGAPRDLGATLWIMIRSSTWIEYLVLRTVRAAYRADTVFAMAESFFRNSGSHLAALTTTLTPAHTGEQRPSTPYTHSLSNIEYGSDVNKENSL